MKKLIIIFSLLIGVKSYSQFKSINPPSFAEVEKQFNLKKEHLKQIAKKDGFNDISKWTFDSPDKKGVEWRSRDNRECSSSTYYLTQLYTYPYDLLYYTFNTQSPKIDGKVYHYRIRIIYSRSNYANGNCESAITNSYSLYDAKVERYKIDGVEASEDDVLKAFNQAVIDKPDLLILKNEDSFEGWIYKGFTTIDSVVIQKSIDQTGNRYKTPFDVYYIGFVCGNITTYDDFLCTDVYNGYVQVKIGVNTKDGKNNLIYAERVGQPKKFKQLEPSTYPSLQIVGELFDYGASFSEIKEGPVKTVNVPLSKKKIKDFQDLIKEVCWNNTWNDVKNMNNVVNVFQNESDLLLVYKAFNELKNGMWTIESSEQTQIMKVGKKTEVRESGYCNYNYSMSRTLSKSDRKSIKGKIGTTSFNQSKYPQNGPFSIQLNFEVMEGEMQIVSVKANGTGVLKLTID